MGVFRLVREATCFGVQRDAGQNSCTSWKVVYLREVLTQTFGPQASIGWVLPPFWQSHVALATG